MVQIPLPLGEVGAKRRVRGCALSWIPAPPHPICFANRPVPAGESWTELPRHNPKSLSVLLGFSFGGLERDAAIDHQRLAGDVARVIAEQEFHGMADVPAGAFHLQHRGL